MAPRARYEVIVVGAGPAGATAALGCARAGLDVLLLDRARFPRPKACGSAISAGGMALLADLGLAAAVRARGRPIHSTRIVATGGGELVVPNEPGWVRSRAEFDAVLVDAAVAAGATFRDGARCTELLRRDGRVRGVRTRDGEVEGRWVVVATGAHGALLGDIPADVPLLGVVTWLDGLDLPEGRAELSYPPALAPHYGWVFPEAEGRVNVGVCVAADRAQGGLRRLLEDFVSAHLGDRLSGTVRSRVVRGAPIACSLTACPPGGPGLLAIGEAARFVQADTAEGIRQALHSGLLASEAIARGGTDEGVRANYQAAVSEALGPGLGAAGWVIPPS